MADNRASNANLLLNSAFGLGMLAFLGVIAKLCFRSKCTNVNFCWGAVQIERNATLEMDEIELENQGIQQENGVKTNAGSNMFSVNSPKTKSNKKTSKINKVIEEKKENEEIDSEAIPLHITVP